MWQNMLQSVSANIKQVGLALERMNQQKKFFQQLTETQLTAVQQGSFRGPNQGSSQEKLESNIKLAEERLSTLAQSYTHILSKEGQQLSKEDSTLTSVKMTKEEKQKMYEENIKQKQFMREQAQKARDEANVQNPAGFQNAKKAVEKTQEQITKIREAAAQKQKDMLEKAKQQKQELIQKTREYTSQLIEKAKQASEKNIADTTAIGSSIIDSAQKKVHQIFENQKKKIEKLELQKSNTLNMQEKRFQQVEHLRLQRRNYNAAKRFERSSLKINQGVQRKSEGNVEKSNQEKFKLCTDNFKHYFDELKSSVFNEYYEVDKFQTPEVCDKVPKTTLFRNGECYEDLLNMYMVLVKEVKVFLDPKSKVQYAEQVIDINNYSEQLIAISQSCIESYIQESSADQPDATKLISSDCQSAHRQALSQLGSVQITGELPFDQFTLVSQGLVFAFDENNLKSIEINCSN